MVIIIRTVIGLSKLSGTQSVKATIVTDAVDILHIKAGDRLLFVEENNRIYIEKAV